MVHSLSVWQSLPDAFSKLSCCECIQVQFPDPPGDAVWHVKFVTNCPYAKVSEKTRYSVV